MKARFTRDTLPHEGGDYKAGQVVDLPESSFDRWFRRSAVEAAADSPAPTTKPESAPSDPITDTKTHKRSKKK
jgi:hypothetical protein